MSDRSQMQSYMDNINSAIEAFEDAKNTSREGDAALAAAELIQQVNDLAGRPANLSADPGEIIKAVDKLSLEGRLNTQGITSPEVWKMLGLTPPGAAPGGIGGQGGPGSGPFGKAEKALSPIVLDLDGDGVETVAVGGGAYFDHEGDGFAENTGWAGADDGLLVWDRNGDGVINDGSELFGNNTLLSDGSKAENGFAALRELDSNLDGKIDQNDSDFANLQVWQDINGDGYSTASEMYTLDQIGVSAINTAFTDSLAVDDQGNRHGQVGSFEWADGSTGDATDVWFKTDTSLSYAVESVEIPPDIAALPDVRGYGTVHDLHQAMALDDTGNLQSLVEAFAAEQSLDGRNVLVEQIVIHWTGSQGAHNWTPTGPGGVQGEEIDGKKHSTVTQFVGRKFIGVGGSNPLPAASSLLDLAFNDVAEYAYASLMAQTHFAALYQTVTLKWDETEERLYSDFALAVSIIETEYGLNPNEGLSLAVEFVRTAGFIGFAYDDVDSLVNNVAALGDDFSSALDAYFDGLPSELTYGTDSGDTVTGRLGSDVMHGYEGDDVLSGRAGDDLLYGNEGNDILDGGYGVDHLEGGMGDDVYMFGRGDGQNTITENDDPAGNTDTIRVKDELAPSDVTIWRDQNNLYVGVKGTTDWITVSNWFDDPSFRVEQVEFSDGTVWGVSTLEAAGFIGTDASDEFYGTSSSDLLEGLAGNDILFGDGGNDSQWWRR